MIPTQRFLASIQTDMTKRNYTAHLQYWNRLMGEAAPTQRNVEEYTAKLAARNYPRHTILTYLHGITHYCDIEDVVVNWKRVRKFLPRRMPFRKTRGYTDSEVTTLLNHCRRKEETAIIRVLCETGMRIGAWNNFSVNKVNVRVYPDDIEEYMTFISKETARILTKEIMDIPMDAVRSITARLRKRAGVVTGETQCNHAFRKRFNTILKMENSVNANIAEKLMGHKNGLDGVYFTPSTEQLYGEWCKIADKLVPQYDKPKPKNTLKNPDILTCPICGKKERRIYKHQKYCSGAGCSAEDARRRAAECSDNKSRTYKKTRDTCNKIMEKCGEE